MNFKLKLLPIYILIAAFVLNFMLILPVSADGGFWNNVGNVLGISSDDEAPANTSTQNTDQPAQATEPIEIPESVDTISVPLLYEGENLILDLSDSDNIEFLDNEFFALSVSNSRIGEWSISEEGQIVELRSELLSRNGNMGTRFTDRSENEVLYITSDESGEKPVYKIFSYRPERGSREVYASHSEIYNAVRLGGNIYFSISNSEDETMDLMFINNDGNQNIEIEDADDIEMTKNKDSLYVTVTEDDKVESFKFNLAGGRQAVGGASDSEWRTISEIINDSYYYVFTAADGDNIEVTKNHTSDNVISSFEVPKDKLGFELTDLAITNDKIYMLSNSPTPDGSINRIYKIVEILEDDVEIIYATDALPVNAVELDSVRGNNIYFTETSPNGTKTSRMVDTDSNEVLPIKTPAGDQSIGPVLSGGYEEIPQMYFAERILGSNIFNIYTVTLNNEVYIVDSIQLDADQKVSSMALSSNRLFFTISENGMVKETRFIDLEGLVFGDRVGTLQEFGI